MIKRFICINTLGINWDVESGERGGVVRSTLSFPRPLFTRASSSSLIFQPRWSWSLDYWDGSLRLQIRNHHIWVVFCAKNVGIFYSESAQELFFSLFIHCTVLRIAHLSPLLLPSSFSSSSCAQPTPGLTRFLWKKCRDRLSGFIHTIEAGHVVVGLEKERRRRRPVHGQTKRPCACSACTHGLPGNYQTWLLFQITCIERWIKWSWLYLNIIPINKLF